MKADPALQSIRTLGYVSHVDSDTIERARAAGIDQVLARSAFSDRLGEILTDWLQAGSPEAESRSDSRTTRRLPRPGSA